MSTDETRPQDATSEPGGPAAAGPVGPDPVDPATGPRVDPATGPATGPADGPSADQAPGQASGPAPTPRGQQPYPQTGFFASIRRGLFPRSDQRWIGGVAGGVADRIGWDPLLVRGILIVSFFLGGLGLVLYGIGWALLPERDGRIHLQEAVRGNFDVAMLGAVAVFLTGFAWGGPLGWWDDGDWGWLGFFFWVAVLGVMFYLIVQGIQKHRENNVARSQGTVHGAQGVPAPRVPTPGVPATSTGPGATGHVPTPHGASAPPFTPAPPVDYRRPDGLVYATGALPAQQQLRQGPVPGAQPQPVYTAPPRPVRTSRGPGGAAVGIVLGLILLLSALLMVAHRTATPVDLSGPAGIGAWLGLSTIVLGIAILVSGLRGRTSGLLGFFAIMALLAGLMYVFFFGGRSDWVDDAASSSEQIVDHVTEPQNEDARWITEGTATVDTIREAEDGFYVRWGEPTIDLSELDLSEVEAGAPITVPIELGAGHTTVIVPKDVAVEADAEVVAGVVRWDVDDQTLETSGVDSSDYFASDEVGDDGAVLSLQITAGAGEVLVSETN